VATVVIVLSVPAHLLLQRGRDAGPAAEPAAATFVGRSACVRCHETETRAWTGSDHDLAMAAATDSTVLGDFDDVTFTGDDITARFFRRDGRFLVETGGAEYEVTHVFGHDPLQQVLIPFPGGRLQCLTVAWDTERGTWFDLYPDREIPPDDWLHWTRAAQTWNAMCAECHSTNLVKGYDPETDTYRTTWSEIDVSCEACHGPGSRHVAWAEIPDMARPQDPARGLVIPTGTQTSAEQVSLCAPCHSRRTELGDYDHTAAQLLDQLLPSVLEEGLYHPDGQILDEVYVWGSFTQSKMYHNDVRCSDCHDPHSLQLRFEGNALCLQCHRAATYDTAEHHFHKKIHEGEPSDGALCVKCHMPEQPYMVIDWRADHSLRVPRPDLSLELGTPNACSQVGCHGDKPVSWSADATRKWYGEARKPHYGEILAAGRQGDPAAHGDLVELAGDALSPAIVRATALSLLRAYPGPESTAAFNRALQDPDPLVRVTAVQSASAETAERYVAMVAPLLFDPVRAVRLQAGVALAAAPDALLQPYQQEALATALTDYREAMRHSLDFAFAAHNLGNLSRALGDRAGAERYYRRAVAIDDLFTPAKVNLAMLLNAEGRNPEAETLLREVLATEPDDGEVAYSLGLLLAEMGRMDEAAGFLERAAAAMPDRVRVWYNLALARRTTGDAAGAAQALQRALALAPDDPDLRRVQATLEADGR